MRSFQCACVQWFIAASLSLCIAGTACAQLGYDATFATNGKYVSGLLDDDIAAAMALHQGKIYVAGVCPSNARPPAPPTRPACVLRLLANGAPDASFNGGVAANTTGRVSHLMGDSNAEVYDIVVGASGKVTVSGRCSDSLVIKACLFRTNTDGSLDTTFGTGGRVFLSNTSSGAALPLLAEPDGSVIMGSTSSNTDPFVGLTRSIDLRRVDNAGVASTAAVGTYRPGNSHSPRQLFRLADGKLLVAAECEGLFVNDPRTFCAARFLANGSVDESFGNTPATNGTAGLYWMSTTTLGASVAQVIRAAVTTDGTLIMVGQCGATPHVACAVGIRGSINPALGLDWPRWHDPNISMGVNPLGRVVSIAATHDNKAVIIGSSVSLEETLVARRGAHGIPDPGLSAFESVILDIKPGLSNAGVLIQSDRKVVIAGVDGASNDFFVGRLKNFQSGVEYPVCTADIDGDGVHTATVDGLLWSRAMLGLTGTAVSNGIGFPAGAYRTTWATIRPYLVNVCGMTLAQ
jgi:uncharacterized delta-60 repeat protein